ncbi:MAG: ferritin-like domain-containing protein [Bauldia sp.]
MQIHDFESMYISGLQEARAIEELLIAALPTLIDAADDAELRDTFRAHHLETQVQLERINVILDCHGVKATSTTDGAIAALVADARDVASTMERGALRDTILIGLAQRIEHEEIAIYGTLAAYAKLLGRHDEKRTLGAILEEERAADEDLSEIADALVNPRAAAMIMAVAAEADLRVVAA